MYYSRFLDAAFDGNVQKSPLCKTIPQICIKKYSN